MLGEIERRLRRVVNEHLSIDELKDARSRRKSSRGRVNVRFSWSSSSWVEQVKRRGVTAGVENGNLRWSLSIAPLSTGILLEILERLLGELRPSWRQERDVLREISGRLA